MKKLIAVLMTVALAGAVFASGSQQAAPASSTSAAADYSKGFSQRVTIEIPVYERAFEGWNVSDNYWTQWMQKEFGDKYNVTVKYIPIGRGTEVQDFSQLLATGKAPDIVFHYDMPQAVNYYNEGVMQELDWAEIKQYAPTFWKYSGTLMEQYGTIDNKKTFFFALRPVADNWTTLIRKDWVEKAGYKVENLTDLETYNKMLLKWKELGLGVESGTLVRNNFTYSYAFRDWPINVKERALYSDLSVADFTWKATHDYLKNMNWRYNKGVLDQEFYLRDNDAKIKAEFVSGRVGTYGFYLASNTDAIASLKANNPGAEVAILPPGAGVPKGKVPQGRAYWPFGMIMGINHESSKEERIALWMFLEWMSGQENLFALQNGVAGEDYTLDAQGIPKKTGTRGASALSQNNNKDYWCLVTEGYRYANDDVFWQVNKNNWAPKGYENLADDLIKYYKATAQYRTPDALFTTVLTKVGEYKADLNNLWQELYVKCATCSEADFETVYAAASKEFLAAGYQEILDEKQKMIDAGKYK